MGINKSKHMNKTNEKKRGDELKGEDIVLHELHRLCKENPEGISVDVKLCGDDMFISYKPVEAGGFVGKILGFRYEE